MSRLVRLIDTGIEDARRNIAFDQALIELHKSGVVPDTIRFLRFRPSALIGRHQALSRELDLAFCRAHDIGIARRITGGGALYLDKRQLGWEIVCDRRSLGVTALADVTRVICEAAADGLSRLGVPVRFRPRNDLEVDGRKLGGTGGFFDGETIFFQGTVLLELDPAIMFGALRVPAEKRARHGAAAAATRVVALKDLLRGALPELDVIKAALLDGLRDLLGIVVEPSAVSAAEWACAAALYREEIGTDAFVSEIDDPAASDDCRGATRATRGGTVTAFVRLACGVPLRLAAVIITGDFFVTPPRVVLDLEAALRDVRVADVPAAVTAFFTNTRPDLLSLSPDDIVAVIVAAAGGDRGDCVDAL